MKIRARDEREGEGMSTGFREIAEHLRAQIEQGVYAPGARIPTEFELAEQFGVSRETVRRALSLLKTGGLLRTARSQGTYVQHPPVRLAIARHAMGADPTQTRLDLGPWETACAEQGIRGRAVAISVEREPAPPPVAARLHLDEGAEVVRRSWEMWAGDQIAQLQEAWMPPGLVDGFPGESPSEEVIARASTSDERARLGLADGAWVLEIWRVTRDPDGRVVGVLRTIANASTSILVYEDLPITPAARHDQEIGQA